MSGMFGHNENGHEHYVVFCTHAAWCLQFELALAYCLCRWEQDSRHQGVHIHGRTLTRAVVVHASRAQHTTAARREGGGRLTVDEAPSDQYGAAVKRAFSRRFSRARLVGGLDGRKI